MARHYDCFTEALVLRIQRGERGTFFGREQTLDYGTAMRIDGRFESAPVDRLDAFRKSGTEVGAKCAGNAAHSVDSLSSSKALRGTPQR